MLQLSERTLGDWLEHWAEVTPDKEYIVYSDRNLRFTWKQFNERVDHMAKGLLAIGVKKDTHVGIWARNVPDWLTFLYACAKLVPWPLQSTRTTSRRNWSTSAKTPTCILCVS